MRVCLKDSAAPCHAPGNITAKTHGDYKVGISSCNYVQLYGQAFPPKHHKGIEHMLGWFRIAGKHLREKHEHNKIGPPKPPNKKKSQRGEANLVVSSPERKYNTDTHYWKQQILIVRNVNANTMAQTQWILKPYAGFDICSIWCSSIEPCLSHLWTLPHRKNTRARWIIPQHLDSLPHRLQIDKEFRVACSGHTSVLLPWNGCCASTQAIINSLQRWMMHHRNGYTLDTFFRGRGFWQEAIAEQKNQR